MKARYVVMVSMAILLIGAIVTGTAQTLEAQPDASRTRATLENVRYYAPAVSLDAPTYAVDGGVLFAGQPGSWNEIATPDGVIVGAVAVDSTRPSAIYIGAANEISIYRSTDGGQNWLRVPVDSAAGGVTDIAVDGMQRLVYVGTDTQGLFRVRDVGSSMVVGGQLLLDEPVRQVATDSTGHAMAFARTDTTLYRAENFGLAWSVVGNLHSSPTALAIANTDPVTVYVGTVDRGLLQSTDGMSWSMANDGLGLTAGSRLNVDALALDPAQPTQLYVATSYLFGSTTVHQSPSRIATSTDGAATWKQMDREFSTNVAELLPVSGATGAAFALTQESRTPQALYDSADAPSSLLAASAPVPAAEATVAMGGTGDTVPWAWLVAALAALALGILVTHDLYKRGVRPLPNALPLSPLDTQTMSSIG